VVRVNLVNDRGIHICKSMLAWQKWGNNCTPESESKKGDKLVGEFYVLFDKENKKEIEQLKQSGFNDEEAQKKTSLLQEAQTMLKKWEEGDKDVLSLWERMNSWVYKGFDETYKKMGISFDRIYHESQTYKSGKNIVQKGIENNVITKKEDGSAWIDLTADGLDEKLLLRADGTSVYITQDIGTAVQRFSEYSPEKQIYVVGNEQNYHFQVLALVLSKLGYQWAKDIFHLSYGMVELPEGKMKSREGTVVDADDLMDEMTQSAREISKELGKLDDLSTEEAEKIIQTIAMGALKYFILKVDPKKNMLFDPKESIDFNGNTGPFIQYTYTRIQSVLRKAAETGIQLNENIRENISEIEKEKEIIQLLYEFPDVVMEAGKAYSPALIANYTYELAKTYNQLYHDFPILKEENSDIRNLRIGLSLLSGNVIKKAMELLGINVPEKM
ncbi:MAG: arginine--tRNA ligase, partial [Bacteroidetes bacterium RIFOXYB2_FULL_35_7]